ARCGQYFVHECIETRGRENGARWQFQAPTRRRRPQPSDARRPRRTVEDGRARLHRGAGEGARAARVGNVADRRLDRSGAARPAVARPDAGLAVLPCASLICAACRLIRAHSLRVLFLVAAYPGAQWTYKSLT